MATGKTMTRWLTAFAAPAQDWWDAGGWPAGSTYWVYQAKSGNGIVVASLQDSYTNRARPGTNDLTLGVAPTWSGAVGWTFNGTTQYLHLGVNPANNYSALIRVGSGFTKGVPFGNRGNPKFYIIYSVSGGTNSNAGYNYAATNAGNCAGAGNFGITGEAWYLNGTGTGWSTSWSGTLAQGLTIGALQRETGVVDTFTDAVVVAFILCSGTLTAAQVGAKAAQMAAL